MLLIDNEAEFKAEFNLPSQISEKVRTLFTQSHTDAHISEKWLQRLQDDLPPFKLLTVLF